MTDAPPNCILRAYKPSVGRLPSEQGAILLSVTLLIIRDPGSHRQLILRGMASTHRERVASLVLLLGVQTEGQASAYGQVQAASLAPPVLTVAHTATHDRPDG